MSHGRPERRPSRSAEGGRGPALRIGCGWRPPCEARQVRRTGCRPRGMASWNVHLDTWAIMEVLFGGRYAKIVAEILRLGGQHPYSLVASQVALGEAAAVILRGGPDSGRMLLGMLRLLSGSRIDPGRCMPPLARACLRLHGSWPPGRSNWTRRIPS